MWIEHRFWRALRELCIPNLPEGINEKRDYMLHTRYENDFGFNIFLLPYFSFPTPASGKCSGVDFNGVAGIRKIVGKAIFDDMRVLKNTIFIRFCLKNRAYKMSEFLIF